MDKGKTLMIEGCSSMLSHEPISLSDNVYKGKGKALAESSEIVTQDLMPKFAGAVSEPEVKEVTPKASDSSIKRESPTSIVEDMNMPLKLLRRSVKIEKL